MASILAFTGVSSGSGGGTATEGRLGSRAPSPLPSALRGFSVLFMVQDLFCEFDVALRTFRTRIVAEDRFAETGGFGQPDAAWNDRPKYLVAEEFLEIRSHLAGEVRPVIEHRKQDPFDRL